MSVVINKLEHSLVNGATLEIGSWGKFVRAFPKFHSILGRFESIVGPMETKNRHSQGHDIELVRIQPGPGLELGQCDTEIGIHLFAVNSGTDTAHWTLLLENTLG